MFCDKCGKNVKDGSKFCNLCGHPFTEGIITEGLANIAKKKVMSKIFISLACIGGAVIIGTATYFFLRNDAVVESNERERPRTEVIAADEDIETEQETPIEEEDEIVDPVIEEVSQEWRFAYAEILRNPINYVIDPVLDFSDFSFFLHDIDNNGIPELIIEHNCSTALYYCVAFTYTDEVVPLGFIDFNLTYQQFHIWDNPDYPGLFTGWSRFGYGEDYYTTLINGALVSTVIRICEWNDNDEDIEFEYTYLNTDFDDFWWSSVFPTLDKIELLPITEVNILMHVLNQVDQQETLIFDDVIISDQVNNIILVMSEAQIEDEILRIREIWTKDRNAISNGTYQKKDIAVGITAFFDGNELKMIEIKNIDTISTQRIYQFENGHLIFAFIEGASAERLYYKNGTMFRWRHTPDSSRNDFTDYDMRHDLSDYLYWQNFALEEGLAVYNQAKP